MQNIKTLLRSATVQLSSTSDSPKLDAELLLAYTLDKPRSYLYSHDDECIKQEQQHTFTQLLLQRAKAIPIAYLTGHQAFWCLDLMVNPHVLIPRPDTETLVETMLTKLPNETNLRVLDLGTGSGAVGIGTGL